MELVKDQYQNDLIKNDLLQKDIKKIVSYVTPYIPLIGIISGGVTVGSHVFEKKMHDIGDVFASANHNEEDTEKEEQEDLEEPKDNSEEK